MKTILLYRVLFLLSVFTSYNFAQTVAVYDISFTSTWNSLDHGTLPPGPHWSDLVGCNHKNSFTLWKEGAPASLGVKRVAELGVGDELLNEINTGITTNTAEQWLQATFSPFTAISTATLTDVEISSEFPLVSVISMIAPSPDWFIGIEKVSLLDNLGEWKTNIEIDVYPWDAGTDSGSSYTASDLPTNPPEGISSLQGVSPFSNEKIGTFTITLKTILNVDEFENNNNVHIYPNPTNNNLTVSNKNFKEIQLYDVIGNLVLTKDITKPQSEFTLNLGQIPEGMYFLKLKTEKNKFITKKIIKI